MVLNNYKNVEKSLNLSNNNIFNNISEIDIDVDNFDKIDNNTMLSTNKIFEPVLNWIPPGYKIIPIC